MITLCGNVSSTSLTASMIRKGREPHSIIICGEHGLGKKTLAKTVAAQLLCESGTGEPCGTCRQCRLLENGAHPDFITVKSNENGNYLADDIRAVTSDAAVSPSEGRYKIYLIPDIDRSVQTLAQIQNILLKLIEEPPESAVIILTARSKEIFLDTIISRTVQLTAQELPAAQAENFLVKSGIEPSMAAEAVNRCGGNIGKSLEYSHDEKLRTLAAAAEQAMDELAARREYGFLNALAGCDGKRDSTAAVLKYMQRIAWDSCRIRAAAKTERVFSRGVCQALSRACSKERLADIYDILSDSCSRIYANCSVSIVINSLAARLFD